MLIFSRIGYPSIMSLSDRFTEIASVTLTTQLMRVAPQPRPLSA
jgi:hypothetical protein